MTILGVSRVLLFFLERSSWFQTWYPQASGEPGVLINSTEDLEARFGDSIRHLGQEHPIEFLLCQALRRLEPPVLVSRKVAGRWLRVYCGINVRTKVDNAADLERDWG